MKFLKELENFAQNTYPAKKELYHSLKDGQSPHTLLITCSDSRIVPSLIGGYEAGEVFVIRNAGNAVPAFDKNSSDSVAATLEYAISVLGIKEVVVCGHSSCGAVGAVMNGVPESLGLINNYLGTLCELKNICKVEDGIQNAVEKNVELQIENIKSYPFVDSDQVKIVGVYYDFVNGESKVLGA